MHFTMKLFEVAPQGLANGLGGQKVAVKMPTEGRFANADSDSGFADIMAALFSMPAAQLEDSLAKLETVAVGDESKEWVPMLDLTQFSGGVNDPFGSFNDQPQSNGNTPTVLPNAAVPDAAVTSRFIKNILGQESGAQGMRSTPGAAAATAENADDMAHAVIEQVAGQVNRKVDGTGLPGEQTGITHQNASTIAQFFPAVQGHDKKLPDALSARHAKLEVNAVSNPSPDTGEELVEQEVSGPIKADALKKTELAQQTAKTATAGKGGNFGEMVSAATKNETGSAGPDKQEIEPPLNDASLKQQVRPQQDQPSTNAPSAPGAVSQGASQPPSGASSQETFAPAASTTVTPTSADPKSDAAIHVNHEDPDVPTNAKEMQTDVIRQIVQRMTLRSDGRQSLMQIRLKPEFLGNLRMDVITENRLVMVRMTAESQAVKEMIEQNFGLLKSELQQHGLQIQKLDVTVAQENDQWPGSQQQAAFDQARQRGERRHGGRGPARTGAQASADAIDNVSSTVSGYVKTSEVDFFA